MDLPDPQIASQNVTTPGRKWLRNEGNWQSNQRKRLRNASEEYVSKRSKFVPSKKFVAVQECCKEECPLRVGVPEQELSHQHFYTELGEYDLQNYHLSGSMQRNLPSKGTYISWSYYFQSKGFNVSAHKDGVEKYKICKKAMMAEENVLCSEFDFGQNLPVPKLPVNDQFYKRLLWLHVFNVNVLNDDTRSYMYFFMQGSIKKGANTVCNSLLDAIERELGLDYYNKIYLLCDSCGGRNKNYLVLYFLSLLAKVLQLEVHQIFPVRGHSYCSCDRNFGIYGNKKKNMETIETPEDYYKLVGEAREPPFTIVKESDVKVIDFESVIEEKMQSPQRSCPRSVVIDHQINLDDLKSGQVASPIGIVKENIADVRSLLRCLHNDNRTVLKEFLDNPLLKKKESSEDKLGGNKALQKMELNKKIVQEGKVHPKVERKTKPTMSVLRKNGKNVAVETKSRTKSKLVTAELKENHSLPGGGARKRKNKQNVVLAIPA
ncbi:hypothetical protein QAD02_007489 [Eretmocerus hayati]|uniref:Uncharacterized protein n=1 Tax=Eretmocerus hayati TaxID=131215 RepID=A0ACC2N453_9HYME|nr:hypothetical protein QAD02_007489 [Eretmocerus hayati]